MPKSSRRSVPTSAPGASLVDLIGRDGSRHRFPSIRSLLRCVGWVFIHERVGEQFDRLVSREPDFPFFRPGEADHRPKRVVRVERRDWVVRDALGAVISFAQLADEQRLVDRERRAARVRQRALSGGHPWEQWIFWNGEGPVPGLRSKNKWHHRFVDARSHAGFRADFHADASDEEPPIRPRLKPEFTLYEDPIPRNRGDRSWKRHRAAQFKGSGGRRGEFLRDLDWAAANAPPDEAGDGESGSEERDWLGD